MIPMPLRFCTLSGVVEDSSGEPMENRLVRTRILDGRRAVVGAVALSSAPTAVYTDEDGGFEISLPQGALARIEVPESGLDATFSVPTSATATLKSIRLREYDPS